MTNDTPTSSNAPLSLSEKDCAALRPMVALLASDLAGLRAQTDSAGYARASAQLSETWHRWVELLALGTAPEHRNCPHCQYPILVKATRCIQCWKRSAATPTLGQ